MVFPAFAIQYSSIPTYEELIEKATHIAKIRVINSTASMRTINSKYMNGNREVIKYQPTTTITEYVLEIVDPLQGKFENGIIFVWAPFGCVGETCISTPVEYKLEKDREYVIFLKRSEDNKAQNSPVFWAYGSNMGVFDFHPQDNTINNKYFDVDDDSTPGEIGFSLSYDAFLELIRN